MKTKTGAQLIADERDRQMKKEGWTPGHDDLHRKFQLTKAALSYALAVCSPDLWSVARGFMQAPAWDWPWSKKWWKPSEDPVRNLVKAGALIAAEIDRLQRLQKRRGK